MYQSKFKYPETAYLPRLLDTYTVLDSNSVPTGNDIDNSRPLFGTLHIKCKSFFADSVYVLGAAALLNTMPLKIELPPARSSKLGIDIHLCPAGLIGTLDTPDSHQIS